MLFIEAEKFMEKIEKTDGSMLLTAPEHDSLTRCLNIMNELLATVSNRRIVKKPWTRDKGCKMIDDCKKFLNH